MNEKLNTVEELVYSNPRLLLALKNVEQIGLKYLPYSTGFEIECAKSNAYDETAFRAIENILDVNTDSTEQRYRIPNGIKGLICLYDIAETLRIYSKLNFGSGIHLHIDFTDCFDKLSEEHIVKNRAWMFEELETWNYTGTYNAKIISFNSGGAQWVRFQSSFKTMEIRIGEMTFDYSLLAKRIIHANKIARKLKEPLVKTTRLERLQNIQKSLANRPKIEIKTQEQIQEEQIIKIVNSRLTQKW